MLHLFSDLYNRLLLTMSDDEFFGETNIIPLPSILKISSFAKVVMSIN